MGVGYSLNLAPPSLQLGASGNGHYLLDANGAPFQLRADSAWCASVALSRSDLDTYWANRAAKDFNAAIIESIERKFGPNGSAATNVNGDAPFVGGDITVRNSAYWTHHDYMIDSAARNNMVCLLSAGYSGADEGGGVHSEGWYAQFLAAGTTAVQDYGRFLGLRYAGRKNIIWVIGGDFRSGDLAIENAFAAGILSGDSNHQVTSHWARDSTGTDGSPSWLTLNSSYTDQGDISSRVLADYQLTPRRPTFAIETRYEATFPGQPTLTAADLRQEAWHAYLSGASGYVYGHHTVWQFLSGWQSALDSTGATQLAKVHSFFKFRQWWRLQPDASSALVTSGRGANGTTSYVAAALADDASFAVIYIPGGGATGVALAQMRGTSAVTCSWIDPTTGAKTAATGSPLAQSSHTFTASSEKGTNAAGGSDWVLLLEADP